MAYSKQTVAGGQTITSDWGNHVQEQYDEVMKDYIRCPGYALATNSGNAYSVTLNPAPTAYVDGMAIAVEINVDCTGNCTLNVNGLGAKSIVKANGTAVTNLKANGIYTVRYNGGNFILQGEGGEYGTAGKDQVLSGYTIGTENGVVDGNILNQGGAVTVTPNTANQIKPAGYYSGDITVLGDADLIPANIKLGVNLFGVAGTHNDVSSVSAGNVIACETYAETQLTTTLTEYRAAIINKSGIVRVSFQIGSDSTSTSTTGQIYKDGVAVGTLRTVSSTTSKRTFTEDIAVTAGDEIQIYAKKTGTSTAIIGYFAILLAETNLAAITTIL
jgi:hypothetical protein